MKNKFITLIALLFLSGAGFAQGVKLGIGLGPTVNFGKVRSNDQTVLKESGLGFKIGLIADSYFTENYGLHTGLNLVLKTFGDKTDILNVPIGGRTSFTTIEIPFQLKLRTNEIGSGFHVTGVVGPTLDLNVAVKSKKTIGNDSFETDVKDRYNLIGSSFRFGAGAEKVLNAGTVTFDVSYHLGITNITKTSFEQNGLKPLENVKTNLGYLLFGFGFLF